MQTHIIVRKMTLFFPEQLRPEVLFQSGFFFKSGSKSRFDHQQYMIS